LEKEKLTAGVAAGETAKAIIEFRNANTTAILGLTDLPVYKD
jgi:hypothetical protein